MVTYPSSLTLFVENDQLSPPSGCLSWLFPLPGTPSWLRGHLCKDRNSQTKAPRSVHHSLSPHSLSPITPSLEFFPSLICLFIIGWNLSTSRRQEFVSLCHCGDLGPQTASTLYPAGAWETGGERRKKFHSSETQPPSPRHSFLLATRMPWPRTLCSSLHLSEQTQDPALGELTS